ncbi:MAG: CHAT domain-containing protein, partial [Opitutaceae bacterium]|nr:CHAT domain-containing protein [Opitutaceae bacterium]
ERELARLAVPNTVQRDALRADPAAFLAHLSSDTAFVGYLLYRHTLPGLKSEARYLALIATADGWQTIPLGRADVINDAIDRYHILIARGGPIAWAQEVRRLLLDPVREALPFTIKHLFVSPDGLLQSVPLATWPEADPAFIAADRHTFATVTSARDLLPTSAPVSRNSLVLAAPVWSGDLSSLAPLPASSAEGAYVAEKLGDATLLTGADATITALTQDHAPRVLHIATHALVVTDPELPAAQLLRRTGLALAGEPGFLDTLQISALDLHGTELVFLSGCETGGGVAANGEGVLGLQRGFARAGARALVLTLWPVVDQDSRKFTEYFYDAFTPSGDAISALHLARKKFREDLVTQGASPAEVLRRAGSYSISVRR